MNHLRLYKNIFIEMFRFKMFPTNAIYNIVPPINFIKFRFHKQAPHYISIVVEYFFPNAVDKIRFIKLVHPFLLSALVLVVVVSYYDNHFDK